MQTRKLEVVILAAGLGERFQKSGGPGHKALAPVWDSRGTLHLLLERLNSSSVNKDIRITILTGRFDADIRAAFEDVRIIYNPEHATDKLPQSLSRACICSDAPYILALFADTLYTQEAIETLVAASLLHAKESERSSEVRALVAVSPIKATFCKTAKNEIRVQIAPHGEVLRFNDQNSDWQMAHAVVWPKQYLPYLHDTAEAGCVHSQWQILQMIAEKTSRPSANAVHLSAFASYDIDTCDDLSALQHQHRIKPAHIKYFTKVVSKERTLNTKRDYLSGLIYHKQCESADAACHEFAMMQYLYRHRPDLVVAPTNLSGRCLKMEWVAGIRLFDLLRYLVGHPRDRAIRTILLDRCLDRLRDMQSLLTRDLESLVVMPYPFESKVIKLLQTITDLLGLPFTQEVQCELANMHLSWDAACVIPFRDATPKNILISIQDLSPMVDAQERLCRLSEAFEQDDSFWQKVPITDIDFTSTRELTTPEDDVISLMGHAITFRPEHKSYASQPLLSMFDPSPQRSDLTWFVRYLRFGGRKLLYKLLNPRGFRIRFRYDEPSFYFKQLPKCLSPAFKALYPSTFDLLLQIRDCAERYRGFIPDQNIHDPFLDSLGPIKADALEYYWQESPLELRESHG